MPFFQVTLQVFTAQDTWARKASTPSLELTAVASPLAAPKALLEVVVAPAVDGSGLECSFSYLPSRFDRESVQLIADRWAFLLTELFEHKRTQVPIADL